MNEIAKAEKPSLLKKFSSKYSVDPDKMMNTLKATAFHQRNGGITNEQMMALLVVADQYNLNPFTKEIYAFPDKGGIIPIVGVDGWCRIINENPHFDGMEFKQSENNLEMPEAKPAPEWIECIIYRNDRNHEIAVREYLDEVYRPPFKQGMKGPWQTHTKRFLRHKAMIQAARIAFGYTGIYDQDEGERIIEGQVISREPEQTENKTETVLSKLETDEQIPSVVNE